MKVELGDKSFTKVIQFDQYKDEILNVEQTLHKYLKKWDNYDEYKDFLGNISVFSRWYAYQSGINYQSGNYFPFDKMA